MSGSNGYIKLWRQIKDSPVWVDDGALKLWLDLLMRVTHKPCKTVLKIGKEPVVVELEAGQCAIRERLFAQDLRVSRNKLRRKLDLLRSLECITTTATSKYILVTVPNWDRYQSSPQDGGSKNEPGSEPPSEPPSEPHNKKTKKTKKGARPSREEWDQYGRSQGIPQQELDEAWDHFEGNGWKTGHNAVKDWRACLRNWHRREEKWARERSGAGNGQASEPLLEEGRPA